MLNSGAKLFFDLNWRKKGEGDYRLSQGWEGARQKTINNSNISYWWCKKVTVNKELTRLVAIKEIGRGIGGIPEDKEKVGRRGWV